MKKQLIALLLAMLLAVTALIPAVTAEDEMIPGGAGYYYVYTENGKSLNVRDAPGGNWIGNLKYGTKIYCYYRDNGTGWALIDYTYDKPGYGYGTYACYISSRYLRSTRPPERPSSGSSTTTGGLDEINAEFKSARTVTPFVVTVRPSRASGWVNLRWAPSTSAELMGTYRAYARLTVIRELNHWYQVRDDETGNVGFINKEYVVQ